MRRPGPALGRSATGREETAVAYIQYCPETHWDKSLKPVGIVTEYIRAGYLRRTRLEFYSLVCHTCCAHLSFKNPEPAQVWRTSVLVWTCSWCSYLVKVKIIVAQSHKDTGRGVEAEIHAFLITALRGSKWLPNPTAVSCAPTAGLGTRVSVYFSPMETAKINC